MRCPSCNKRDNRALETRHNDADNTIWRKRKCNRCQRVWTTTEARSATHDPSYATSQATGSRRRVPRE
jgi:transcriptional regulator NrdR family protein